jgi:exopolysaccharide biosynthesis polyprenyl glycosylphosphotransferase
MTDGTVLFAVSAASVGKMSLAGMIVRRHFEPLTLTAQVLLDLVVLLGACWLGWWLGSAIEVAGAVPPVTSYEKLWYLTAAVCLVTFHAFGMYSPVKSLLNVEEFKSIAKSTVVAFLVLFTLVAFLRVTRQEPTDGFFGWLVRLHRLVDVDFSVEQVSRLTVLITFVLIWFLTTVSRFCSFKLIQSLHRRGVGNRNVLIIGTGATGRWLERKFVLVPTLGLRLVGFVSESKDEIGRRVDRTSVLGTLDDLDALVGMHKVSEVFVAMPEASEEHVLAIIERLERLGVTYRVVPRFYHLMAQRVQIENLDSIPLITRAERDPGLIGTAAKRVLDLVGATLVLVCAAPLFAIAAVLIKRESPGPVFFVQNRIGKDGRSFPMLKFRTMFTHLSGDAPKPRDHHDPRVTASGRFLRRYSLDELPQFLNVLRGEMSIVGPRPEMKFIVDRYGPLERERLRAKPGITGLWQISYHRSAAIHENLDYDIYYVENRSLLLDVLIIFLTVFAVAKGTGAH